jgi:hypothetical protein
VDVGRKSKKEEGREFVELLKYTQTPGSVVCVCVFRGKTRKKEGDVTMTEHLRCTS